MDSSGVGLASLKKFLAEEKSYNIYDFSQLEAFNQCKRKYSYRYIDMLAVPGSIEAEFSSKVIHPICADVFVKSKPDFARTEMLKLFQNFGAATKDLGWTFKQKAVYTIETAKQMYTLITQRKNEYLNNLDSSKAKIEEIYWRTLPDVKNSIWLSKPDVVVVSAIDKRSLPIEVKVSAYGPNEQMNPFDRQLLSQAWTMKVDTQVRLFNGIQLDSANRITSINCLFQTNTVDPELQSEWLDEIQFDVETLQRAVAKNLFPKHSPRACNDFGKQCPMYDFCLIGKNRKVLIDTRPKTNPLSYLGL